MRHDRRGGWGASATMAKLAIFAAFAAIVFVVEQLGALWEFAFISKNFGDAVLKAWELTYYVANTILVIIAIFALGVAWRQTLHARKQAVEAENTRLASIYIEILKKYAEDGVAASRRSLSNIRRKYPQEKQGTETMGAYMHRILKGLYDERETGEGSTTYADAIFFLEYLEDIGVLIRRSFISKDIIFDYMCGAILTAEQLLKDHLIWRRQQSDSRARLYANALWLMHEAGRHTDRFEFNEGDYRL